MKFSTNDKLVLSVYKQGQGITATVKNGFASVVQKQSVVGLTLLLDAKLSSGEVIPAGSEVFFEEEVLMNSPAAKFPKKADFVEPLFIIMDYKLSLAVVKAD